MHIHAGQFIKTVVLEDTNKKVRGQSTEGEDIFANYICDKGLEPITYM